MLLVLCGVFVVMAAWWQFVNAQQQVGRTSLGAVFSAARKICVFRNTVSVGYSMSQYVLPKIHAVTILAMCVLGFP